MSQNVTHIDRLTRSRMDRPKKVVIV